MTDIDGVFNIVAARVADPLTACNKLPFGGFSERITHSAVTARNANAAAYGVGDIAFALLRQAPAGKARDDKIVGKKRIFVRQALDALASVDRKSV